MRPVALCDPPSVFAAAPLAKSLRARLISSVEAIRRSPEKSFPQIFPADGYKAFDRMLHNPRVVERPPLAEVVADTLARLVGVERPLAIHDTTEMCFGGEVPRSGLGRLNKNNQGFLAHTCLAVALDRGRMPIGVLHLEPLVRTDAVRSGETFSERYADPSRESQRWHRGVLAVEKAVGRPGLLTHVMDREADDFTLFFQMEQVGARFVVRQRVDRVLGSQHPLRETLRTVQRVVQDLAVPVAARTISLSRRGSKRPPEQRKSHPDRDLRTARVEISGTALSMQRPSAADTTLPRELSINVVHVQEIDVPAGQEAVSWWLLTNLPVNTPEEILAVVDAYLARWIIEEFFKALKTGCSYERRQLESFDALWITLILLLPIATRLLQLRHVAREEPERPAAEVVTEEMIEVLRAAKRTRLPAAPTTQDILLAIAALGGHFKHNGPPGWLVLWRGMRDLNERVQGWRDAMATMSTDATKIRDQ